MLHDIRYYGGVALLYIITIGTIGAMLCSSQLFGTPARAGAEQTVARHPQPVKKTPLVISGKPFRIVIPTSGIDLPVDDGHYDQATNTWTLSPTHAQFAVMTTRPNDHAGTTFIYGHGTDAVFGKIGTNRPPVGTEAKIYTEGGHEFSYILQTIRDLKPSDTSILQNTVEGPPQLIVQTCTGVFSEWRTMFIFSLGKVD